MPLALLLIVGILYVGTVDRQKNKLEVEKNSQVLITKTLKNNPTIEEVKVEPKESEIVKEEVKVEPNELETVKEEVKVEPKELETVKEEAKVESKEPETIKEEAKVESKEPELVKEEVDVTEPPKSYLSLVLYIIVGLLVVFTGRYFFSNRRSGQLAGSTVDNSRVDIEENIASETQEQQPTEETTQPETQEQQPVEDETQSDKTEQRPVEEDENNNK